MRKTLVAVLAADVVGYTRMMGADAASTIDRIHRLRSDILEPAVSAQHGHIGKSMGDGWIMIFNTVQAAIECAINIQNRLNVEAEIQLRIGVHLGDITRTKLDLFG